MDKISDRSRNSFYQGSISSFFFFFIRGARPQGAPFKSALEQNTYKETRAQNKKQKISGMNKYICNFLCIKKSNINKTLLKLKGHYVLYA
jgi:hypothetical protein